MGEPIRLDRTVPFVDATLRAVEGTGPIEEAASILAAAEQKHGLKLVWQPDLVEDRGPFDWWCESSLFPFLDETHLVIAGGDLFQDCEFRMPDGLAVGLTWRHWGEALADWANRRWVPRPGGLGQTKCSRAARPWEYMDFYMDVNLADLIEDYSGWSSAILRAVESKCRADWTPQP